MPLVRICESEPRRGFMLKPGRKFGPWVITGHLGAGGQGVVYRVRDQDGIREGALKRFAIKASKKWHAQVMTRLEREIDVLTRLHHPNIVKLLDSNIEQRWIVMEFLSNGNLADHLSNYKGHAVKALKAVRPLVEGVAILHHAGLIHRDIKLPNIFVGRDGRLVLGDFGVVFENSEAESRITNTNERIGSRDWIAPWADIRERIEEPNPKLDVFALSKVIWCMLSGLKSLPLWYHQKDSYDLTRLFREQTSQQVREGQTPQMAAINWILDSCIVENEADCRVPSARELLGLIDSYLWAWSAPEERGSHWRYYSAERAKELFDGLSQVERNDLISHYRAAYLARDDTLPNDVFIDWNVQSEIMRDLTRDESNPSNRTTKLWPAVVSAYFRS